MDNIFFAPSVHVIHSSAVDVVSNPAPAPDPDKTQFVPGLPARFLKRYATAGLHDASQAV